MTPSDIPSAPDKRTTNDGKRLTPAFKLNVDPDWLIRMAEKENCCIVSVGGFFTRDAD